MMNKNRRFMISDRYTLDELAEKLTQRSWCLCSGFLAEGLLFLNDAFSEDGAQEFAVFRCSFTRAELEAEPCTLDQVESLTCSWMSPERLRSELHTLIGKPSPEATQDRYTADNGTTVTIVCSVGSLHTALDGSAPRRVLATHPIKTHTRENCCHHCA
jgi:hypothetical protein